ncbi:hypothetical protein SDC9_191238 [bioreactor metagenome]|uniref:Uncharacterized protein n=1 Tax=bioreactor metagenome TaxID=1076179 RepID=A0A645HXE4_9ZZZZ
METLHQLGQRQTHVVKRLWPAVERLQAIDQHNLTIKAQEVILIKSLHDFFTVVIKPVAQHARIGVFICLRQLRFSPGINVRPREELQRRRARHISWQNKTARLNKVQSLLLALMQILRPGSSNFRQTVFVSRCQWIQPVA